MKSLHIFPRKFLFLISVSILLNLFCGFIFAQESAEVSKSKSIYDRIKAFSLDGGQTKVSNLVLKRDRVVMTFDGTFYFSSAVEGRVTGAVFIGEGTLKAETPPSDFEKDNIKRLLGSEAVESDFKTAVLRFTDDTFDIIGKNKTEGTPNQQAQTLASENDVRILKETGANLSSRLAVSILNKENPGFFFAAFDKGKLNDFNLLIDHQNRIPTSNFGVNGGEKGLIFSYRSSIKSSEIWTAFYGLEDYQKNNVAYSDVNDLIDINHYKMNVDLLDPKNKLGLQMTMSITALYSNINAITFNIGESLGETDKERLKKQMFVKKVQFGENELEFVQEDWEGGFTVFLPREINLNEKFDLDFEVEGDFIRQAQTVSNCHYPISNSNWYPRHGYLDRATFDFSYTHSKKLKVASVGLRQSETPSEDKENIVTTYRMKFPVALATFALGPFERYTEEIKWDTGETPVMLELHSVNDAAFKEDLVLAEINNSVRYFHKLFGKYPYENFGATFHPYGFGQGFASMLMLPRMDRSNKYTYSFVAHETAHQWWGNIVAWRSYRDQWLSEGFAEYSGVLYTGIRKDHNAAEKLIEDMRDSLREPPRTQLGLGKGDLNDVGPIILGHRLNSSKTYGAYNTLIYNKGALTLRMLHFMFTDPATGNGDAFFAMMKDFVERYRDKTASTDDFRNVANEHFVKTPISQTFKIKDLNWFFKQWVYETSLPSYTLNYSYENQSDGSVMFNGKITQKNAPDNWAMVLPIVFTFKGDKHATVSALAFGPERDFKMKLPMKPTKVELDPQKWILSEKTSTK